MSLAYLINFVNKYIKVEKVKEEPSVDNISGSYEEMFSNWRNKVEEAAQNIDQFSSFMNLCSLQKMIHHMAEQVYMEYFEIMDKYNPNDLIHNINLYDNTLEKYKETYHRAGMVPKHYADVNEFAKDYMS